MNKIDDSHDAWQTAFTDSLFNGLSDQLAASFSTTDKVQQEKRFAIYQNKPVVHLGNDHFQVV